MEQAILPAEIMCAIFLNLPDVWWIMAARTCRWWRVCIHEAAEIRRVPMRHFLQQVSRGLTVDAAVRGGHVGVIDWLVQESRVPLEGAAAAAAWMATRGACSWQEAVVDAVREGVDVAAVVWIARESVGHTLPMAAAVVYGRDDCVDAILRERTVSNFRTWQGWRRSRFPPGDWVRIAAHATACAVVAGKFGRDSHFDSDTWKVGASTLFVAAAVGVPIDHLESKVADTAQHMIPAARWLEAHRPSFDSTDIANLCDAVARDSNSTLGQAMPNAVALPEDATAAASWPRMRRPLPRDFLPGGVLGTFCHLDTGSNHATSGTVYLIALLDPLLVDPSDRQALRSCVPLFRDEHHMSDTRPRFLWSYDAPPDCC
ncbi:F-box domain-containing protein [Pandoravirus kuranda]|uniref:F-box domain-containing protein n=2 Tax=Pandoravirus TaxID=2060084 RepID=A0AA95J3M2_9VIRU|nr:F-box incomplete domain containing protein [Pandoravirus neocaledonia]AVK76072.1 F-box incomplete domain containing protein [Pandoravirus neocaledonia]WBR14607.1 F-box domain-containing protein [Pandoravirus kuranda]